MVIRGHHGKHDQTSSYQAPLRDKNLFIRALNLPFGQTVRARTHTRTHTSQLLVTIHLSSGPDGPSSAGLKLCAAVCRAATISWFHRQFICQFVSGFLVCSVKCHESAESARLSFPGVTPARVVRQPPKHRNESEAADLQSDMKPALLLLFKISDQNSWWLIFCWIHRRGSGSVGVRWGPLAVAEDVVMQQLDGSEETEVSAFASTRRVTNIWFDRPKRLRAVSCWVRVVFSVFIHFMEANRR